MCNLLTVTAMVALLVLHNVQYCCHYHFGFKQEPHCVEQMNVGRFYFNLPSGDKLKSVTEIYRGRPCCNIMPMSHAGSSHLIW